MNRFETLLSRLKIDKRFHSILTWFFNCGLFYIGWVLAIKLVRDGLFAFAPLVCLVIITLHLLFADRPFFETLLVISLAFMGSLVDSFFASMGIIAYHGPYQDYPGIAPPWVTALWGLYATSINHSFAWLDRRLLFAALLGFFGGPITYLAVIRAGAADLMVPLFEGALFIGLVWGCALPLSFLYNRLLKKMIPQKATI